MRDLQQVLNGKGLVHDLHRHDFYFVLAIQEGTGIHEIDFVHYPVQAHTVFILRPGQVHKLELSADSQGFLLEFDLSFYQPKHTLAAHLGEQAEQEFKKFQPQDDNRLFPELYGVTRLNSSFR